MTIPILRYSISFCAIRFLPQLLTSFPIAYVKMLDSKMRNQILTAKRCRTGKCRTEKWGQNAGVENAGPEKCGTKTRRDCSWNCTNSRTCVDLTSPNLAKTYGNNRCLTNLCQSTDILLHFQTRADYSWLMSKMTSNFAHFDPLLWKLGKGGRDLWIA